jgi:hypothetical protein
VNIASLRFIECICTSKLLISDSTTKSYITLIELSFLKSATTIQDAASEALSALSRRHDVSTLLPKWIIAVREGTNFVARRGWAAALGFVSLTDYIDVLTLLTEISERETDVEVKRNAVKSIGAIFTRSDNLKGTFLRGYADEILLWCRGYGHL